MESIHINTDVRFSQRFLKQDLLHFYPKGPESCLLYTSNHSPKALEANLRQMDKNSEMLVGHVREGDKVTERRAVSCFDGQYGLKF